MPSKIVCTAEYQTEPRPMFGHKAGTLCCVLATNQHYFN